MTQTATQQADPAAEIRAAAEAIRKAIEEDPTDEFAATCGVAMAELLEAHADAYDAVSAWPTDLYASVADEVALKLARAINDSAVPDQPTGACTCPHPADSHDHTGCQRRIGSCDTCHCTAKRCPACGGVGERLNGCQSLSHIEVRG
jgi:hypothetical protein